MYKFKNMQKASFLNLMKCNDQCVSVHAPDQDKQDYKLNSAWVENDLQESSVFNEKPAL